MVSIREVAEKCGVSASTVSKALNNQSDVSAAKKELIRRVAKEMGYSPNSSARALKTNRSKNLGVLFADGAQSGLTHEFFSVVLDSFKVEVEKYGYDITFITNKKNDGMSYLEHCRFRGFDGVIIACVNFDEPDVQDLLASEIPLVTVDYTYNNTICILSDNVQGMQQITEYAISQGHRKIAYMYGEKSAVTTNRLSGFFITLEKHKIKIPDEYLVETRYRNMKDAEMHTEELLNLPDPPTCIIYCDDVACFGGMNAIHARGLSIPEDISIAGYDGVMMARRIEPVLTTVNQDAREIGRQAGEKLVSLIERPRTTLIDKVVVGTTLIEGKTVAKIN